MQRFILTMLLERILQTDLYFNNNYDELTIIALELNGTNRKISLAKCDDEMMILLLNAYNKRIINTLPKNSVQYICHHFVYFDNMPYAILSRTEVLCFAKTWSVRKTHTKLVSLTGRNRSTILNFCVRLRCKVLIFRKLSIYYSNLSPD